MRAARRATNRVLVALLATAAAAVAAHGIAPRSAAAQAQPPRNASVDDLVASTAPALILLGGEPATVQRPTTPRGLKATLLSAIGEGGALADDFAVEVTPFWLVSRPTFTVDDYFAGFATRVRRSASFAVASTRDESADGTERTNLAGSFRVLLLSPGRTTRYDTLRARIATAAGACVRLTAPADEECIARLAQSPPVDDLRAYIERPTGLSVELAGGLGGTAATDDAESLRWQRFGVWITPTWTISATLDAVAVGRYLRQRSDDPTIDDLGILDYGARLLWRPTRRFGLSAEAVGRRYDAVPAGVDDETTRYGALLEYGVSDQWFVFYTLGKDFAAADAPTSPLLSKLGLHFGLGRSPQVAVPAR